MRTLTLFILSFFAAAAFAQELDDTCPPRFSYCGYSGPAQWPNLPIAKNDCGGTTQSPIDLGKPPRESGEAIKVNYTADTARIQNTGHDIKVTPTEPEAGEINVGGKTYELRYLHFHVPNEHRIPEMEAVAEVHIVHERVEGEVTYRVVIGVMLVRGDETYPALAPVFANLPTKACTESTHPFDFAKLLLDSVSDYYTYVGSLTTPLCSEGVIWCVLGAPRPILATDLAKLEALGKNNRPLQVNPQPLAVKYILPPAPAKR